MLKLPAWKFLKADTSTADAIGEQLAQLDRAYAEADAELSRLAAARPALLLDTTVTADAKLEKHDVDMAAARRVMEATAARRAALEVEWREAEAREAREQDQAERTALYKEAVAADKERSRLYADYAGLAEKLAAKLRRIDEIDALVLRANESRPEGAVSIGFHFAGHRSRNGFLDRISLPNAEPDEPDFWRGTDAAGPALSAAQRFHLDYFNLR